MVKFTNQQSLEIIKNYYRNFLVGGRNFKSAYSNFRP